MSFIFTKMQALGNDFMVIDGVRQSVQLTSLRIREMADRHFGVGFDQLLLIEPAQLEQSVDFNYRIFNSNGKEVAQCGNGARCVARYLWDQGLIKKQRITLGTAERQLEAHVLPNGEVEVNMGLPLFEPKKIPFMTMQQKDSYEIEIASKKAEFSVVNLGNPHAVFLVKDIKEAPVRKWGEFLQRHPCFPEQVNVEFMQCISLNHISLRVYERGVGETLACGSGACAAVVIGRQKKMLGEKVRVDLTKGALCVRWSGGHHDPVWLQGGAETVYKGEWLKG